VCQLRADLLNRSTAFQIKKRPFDLLANGNSFFVVASPRLEKGGYEPLLKITKWTLAIQVLPQSVRHFIREH
jgi:hypothetical protein